MSYQFSESKEKYVLRKLKLKTDLITLKTFLKLIYNTCLSQCMTAEIKIILNPGKAHLNSAQSVYYQFSEKLLESLFLNRFMLNLNTENVIVS